MELSYGGHNASIVVDQMVIVPKVSVDVAQNHPVGPFWNMQNHVRIWSLDLGCLTTHSLLYLCWAILFLVF